MMGLDLEQLMARVMVHLKVRRKVTGWEQRLVIMTDFELD